MISFKQVDAFLEKFGIEVPVLNSAMADITTPEMVAAVSNAGGLGVLAGDFMHPEELRAAIARVRELTNKPFAVNLRVLDKKLDAPYRADLEVIAKTFAHHQQFGELEGIEVDPLPDFEKQIEVILEEKIGIVCTSFGGLREIYSDALKAAGVKIIGTATTLREAKVLRSAEVDAIVVQGSEAGGPRLSFELEDKVSMVGLSSLIGSAARATGLPIIASGGIMTGRQMFGAVAAGACGVMIGTALLRSPESAAVPEHKNALPYCADTGTVLTSETSGRLTRVVYSRFAAEEDATPEVLLESVGRRGGLKNSYPSVLTLLRSVYASVYENGGIANYEFGAGQGAQLASAAPAADTVSRMFSEYADCLKGF